MEEGIGQCKLDKINAYRNCLLKQVIEVMIEERREVRGRQ
jgi:hypothetical protein